MAFMTNAAMRSVAAFLACRRHWQEDALLEPSSRMRKRFDYWARLKCPLWSRSDGNSGCPVLRVRQRCVQFV
jgi:hypothetical protein